MEGLEDMILKRARLLRTYYQEGEEGEWKPPTLVDIVIAKNKLADDVYDCDIPRETFTSMYTRLVERLSPASPVVKKERYKASYLRTGTRS